MAATFGLGSTCVRAVDREVRRKLACPYTIGVQSVPIVPAVQSLRYVQNVKARRLFNGSIVQTFNINRIGLVQNVQVVQPLCSVQNVRRTVPDVPVVSVVPDEPPI